MTAKQKIALVAAQYAQLAREMTKQGDLIGELAKEVTENAAQRILDELIRQSLIDQDGMLTVGAQSFELDVDAN